MSRPEDISHSLIHSHVSKAHEGLELPVETPRITRLRDEIADLEHQLNIKRGALSDALLAKAGSKQSSPACQVENLYSELNRYTDSKLK